jgi:hypothetical protein
MKLDESQYYKCPKCEEKAAKVISADSEWSHEFNGYVNTAWLQCKCGTKSIFRTVNPSRFYEDKHEQTTI